MKPMLENNKPKSKQRLGRGLGSLFSEEETEPGMMQQGSSNEIPKNTAPKATANVPNNIASPAIDTSKAEATPATAAISTPAPAAVTATPEKAAALEATIAATPPQQAEPAIPAGARIWTVSIDKVIPNKGQPRKEFNPEKIQELAASIKEQGILQPIVVRKQADGLYEIIAGERRWRATQAAGLHEIPVIIKEADNKKVLEWALIENIQRENLNPIEESEAYNQLIADYKYTHQELAEKMGKDRATVSNALRLLTLPKEIREFLREQKISTGHAKALLSLENSEQQRTLAKEVIAKGLSVRAIEKEISRIKKGGISEPIESSVASRMAQALAEEMQKELGTKVAVEYSGGKGRVVISFYSDSDLTMISERIKGLV
jgi:ParB family transcriptional regulator, chromosome partitioning protein